MPGINITKITNTGIGNAVPGTRTLTIGGIAYDLSQDRTWPGGGGGVSGSGTTNYLSKWTSGTAIGSSVVYDNGTNVGIGTATPAAKLDINGTGRFGDKLIISADASNEQFVIQRASNTNEQLIFGFNSADYATITAVEQGVSFRPICINPSGGNLLVGTVVDLGYKLAVNGATNINGGGLSIYQGGDVGSIIHATGQVLSGSSTNPCTYISTTWNTTGNADGIMLNVTNTASGASSKLLNLKVDSVSKFSVSKAGAITTAEPTGYTAQPWKLGDATSGSVTPDYHIKVEINGQIYSIPALLGTP